MITEIAAVEFVATEYLAALYAGDADKLAELFIPEASLFSRGADGVPAVLPRDRWLEVVRGRQSAQDAGHANTNAIFAVEVVDTMAIARVTASHPPNRFDDFLSLVKTGAGWRIVAKTFTVTRL